MAHAKIGSRPVTILRWIARIWSLILVIFIVLTILSPDPYATEPVPAVDWFLLSLWGVSVLGLVVAWRWERLGGILAIAAMFIRELAWILIKGSWFAGFLILWAAVAPPAILFLLAWRLDRRASGTGPQGGDA
jgi:hypothetical protein